MKFYVLPLLLVLKGMKAQVLPSRYLFQEQSESVNGSSPTGHCSNATISSGLTTCTQPSTSVLFDGDIPTLTGLDGDMWASQLLTLQATNSTRTDIVFDFTSTPDFLRVKEVELVMFNCPEWGIAVQTIAFLTAASVSENSSVVAILNPMAAVASCDSLVRVCIPQSTTNPVITLQFFPPPGSDWVHLAGVKFYGNDGRCTTDQPPTTGSLDSTERTTGTFRSPTESPPTSTNTAESNSEVATSESGACLSCSSTPIRTILASALTVVILAILVTAILIAVLVAVCKYHPKFTLGVAETGPQAGGEDHVYEDMSEDRRSVGMESDPGYIFMNIGVGEGNFLQLKQTPEEGNTFQLQENEAYAAHLYDD